MKLTPIMQRYVLHWGEMGTRWGINRTIAQIHAVLYLAPEPVAADEIAETLSVARSNVSTSLRELQSWGLITPTHVLGDRRDHYTAKQDVWDIFMTIVEQRKRREFDPTLSVLRQCVLDSERDEETPGEIKDRITAMLEFMETLSAWYDDVKRLPKSTLGTLTRMGARISKFATTH